MSRPGSVAEPPPLPDLWHRWTEVVTWFARKRRARRGVRAAAYEALQRQVVVACCEAAAADPSRTRYYDRLADLAAPWLTTGLLERTDRVILLDLLERCKAVDRELGGRAHFQSGRVRTIRFLARSSLVVLLGLIGWWLWERSGEWLVEARRGIRLATRDLTETQHLLALGIVVGVLVALVCFRSTRGK